MGRTRAGPSPAVPALRVVLPCLPIARTATPLRGPARAVRDVPWPPKICQYCGVDLDETPPVQETGWLDGVECARCPPEVRRSQVLARRERVRRSPAPACGTLLSPVDTHPDVLVVKEVVYEVCAACGERCGVASIRKVRDVSGGTM